MRLLGVGEFGVLPDLYWKSRIMLMEMEDAAAEAFVGLAGKEAGAYYEMETRDRRYSRFPNYMYMGVKAREGRRGIPELSGMEPPETEYRADWDYTECWGGGITENKAGAKMARADGRYEECWKYGELFLIRSADPIVKRETEGELLEIRNIHPFEKTFADRRYASKGRRLEWNYEHRRVTDGKCVPIDGVRRYKDGKVVMRFRRGRLDGDPERGKVVRPAYEEDGHLEYWRGGLLHRDGGRPAIISGNGAAREWWVNGVFVRAESGGR
jgi:hypothetical protein